MSHKFEEEIAQKKAIDRILASDDGKLLINYLANLVLFDVGIFCTDNNAMHFREGRRSILTTLLALGNFNLEEYLVGVKQYQHRRLEDFAERSDFDD